MFAVLWLASYPPTLRARALGQCVGLAVLGLTGLDAVQPRSAWARTSVPVTVVPASETSAAPVAVAPISNRLELADRLKGDAAGEELENVDPEDFDPENIDLESTDPESSGSDGDVMADPLPAADILQQADEQAARAELLARAAASAADWDGVMAQWMGAIALAQSIPPESPSRIVAQRQLRGYLQRLQDAQQRAEQASSTSGLPSLGSALFDAQLAGYLSYVATAGTPDILIVGSSRALQGIDPQALQENLAARGYQDLKVFNFSVNGATAQVVNFILSQLLPRPLPQTIIWGDGSRAFNDGRRDRTWEGLVVSPGYRAVARGQLQAAAAGTIAETAAVVGEAEAYVPAIPPSAARAVTVHSPLGGIASTLDSHGFSAIDDRFDPQTYYRQFPRVSGRYDGAYSPFRLNGPQTVALGQLAAFATAQDVRLLFVNLPLSSSYLDSFRRYYEGQFQQYLQSQSQLHGFDAIDLLTQWHAQPGWFADPSHINRYGAATIAAQLAQHPQLLAALTPAARPPLTPPPD